MSDTPELAGQPAGSTPVQPAPLRTEIIPVRVTPEEHVALKTRARRGRGHIDVYEVA